MADDPTAPPIPVAEATPDVKETVYGYHGDSTPDYNSVVLHKGDRENHLSYGTDHQSVALTIPERQRIFPDAQIDPATGRLKSTGKPFQWKGNTVYDDDTAPEGDYRVDVFNPDHPPDHLTLKSKREGHYSALSSRALFGTDYASYPEPAETDQKAPEENKESVNENKDDLLSPSRMTNAIRSEYPEYANVPDTKLYKSFIQKYPTGLEQFKAVSPAFADVPDDKLLSAIHKQYYPKFTDDEFIDAFNPPSGATALYHSITEQLPTIIPAFYESVGNLAKFPERAQQEYENLLNSLKQSVAALGMLPKPVTDEAFNAKPSPFEEQLTKNIFEWGSRFARKGQRYGQAHPTPVPSGANISGQIAQKAFQGIGSLPQVAPAFIGGPSVSGLVLGMAYDYTQGAGRARENALDKPFLFGKEAASYRLIQQWLLYTPRGRALSALLWAAAGVGDQVAQAFLANPKGELEKAFKQPGNYLADLVSTAAVNSMFGMLASLGADKLTGPEKATFNAAREARGRGDYREAAQLMDKTFALLPEGPKRAASNNLLAWRNEAIEAKNGDAPMEQPGQRGFLTLKGTHSLYEQFKQENPQYKDITREEFMKRVRDIPDKELFKNGPNGFTDDFFYSGIDLGKAWDWMKELLTPEHRTFQRASSGGVIGPEIGNMQRENQQFAQGWYRKQNLEKKLKFAYEADQREAFWNNYPKGQLMKFFELHEAGKSTGKPVVDRMFQLHDNLMKALARLDQARGFRYDLRDSYIYHMIDREDIPKLEAEIKRRGWGDPSFMHAREIPTVEMLHALGFKLKTYNLEKLDQMRIEASTRAEMRASVLEGMNNSDPKFPLAMSRLQMAKLEKSHPEIAKEVRQQMAPQVWRSPRAVGKDDMHNTYWVHKDADFMLHRATDPVTWHPVVGVAVGGMNAIKQRTVGLNLAWSMYHQLHMLPIGAADSLSSAFSKSLAGTAKLSDWANAVADVMSVGGYGHAKSLMYNQKLLNWYQANKAWQKAGTPALRDLSPYEQKMFHLQHLGGFVPLVSHERQVQIARWISHNAMTKTGDKILGLGYGIMSARPYQQWLFGRAIPSMKMFSYDRAALSLLDARPELERPQYENELRVELRKIRDQVDARYGEQNLRQSFTDPHVKYLGQAVMLSYSWLKSFIDVYGGGIHDMTKFIKDKPEKPQATNRIAYLVTLSAISFATNALIAQLIGTGVKSIQDLFYPNIGYEKDGKTLHRVKPPFWTTTEIGGMYHDIEAKGGNPVTGMKLFFQNKLQPALATIGDLANNKDYFGTEISPAMDPNKNPLDNLLEQAWTKAAFVARNSVSFSLQAGLKPGGDPTRDMLFSLLGLPPAPAYAQRSGMENRIIRDFIRLHIPPEKTQKAQQQIDAKRNLRQALQNGDTDGANKAKEDLTRMGVSDKSIKQTEDTADQNEGQRLFSHMTPDEQRGYWKEMGPEDQKEFGPYLHKSLKEEFGQ